MRGSQQSSETPKPAKSGVKRQRTSSRRAKALALFLALFFVLLLFEAILRLIDFGIDPYRLPSVKQTVAYEEEPFVKMCRPFFAFNLPGAEYTLTHPSYSVEYKINAYGFREREIEPNPPEGFKRLICVGDSYTEGYGVESSQAYPAYLGQKLDSLGWEVVNAAMHGSGPFYHGANVTRYLALNPDACLLALFDRDFGGDFGRAAMLKGFPELADRKRLVNGTGRPVSYVANLIWTRLFPGEFALCREYSRLYEDQCRDLGPETFDRLSKSYEPDDYGDELWTLCRDYLDFFVSKLQERGVQVYVTHLSVPYDEVGDLLPHDPQTWRRFADRIGDDLAGWTSERRIPFLSLKGVLREASRDGAPTITIPGDGHFSVHGNLVAGKRLAEWLEVQLPADEKE